MFIPYIVHPIGRVTCRDSEVLIFSLIIPQLLKDSSY